MNPTNKNKLSDMASKLVETRMHRMDAEFALREARHAEQQAKGKLVQMLMDTTPARTLVEMGIFRLNEPAFNRYLDKVEKSIVR